MVNKDELLSYFALNLRLIQRQAGGLSHSDSLIQPPVRGNCMNWVLGHILLNRNLILTTLDSKPIHSVAQLARYATDSEPVTVESKEIWQLSNLLDGLTTLQGRIAAMLEATSPDNLARQVPAGEQMTSVANKVFGFYFHETYHVGQLELLCKLAGKNDKVI